jgi:hypothetical protein
LFLLFEKGKKERKKLLLYLCGASTTSSVKHVCIKYRKKELRSGINFQYRKKRWKAKEKNKKFLHQRLERKGQFFLFVTFFFNRKEVFLFSWKKKRKEKNKKVSILLEVVDDANQEQIKKKKLLTSQVFGENV